MVGLTHWTFSLHITTATSKQTELTSFSNISGRPHSHTSKWTHLTNSLEQGPSWKAICTKSGRRSSCSFCQIGLIQDKKFLVEEVTSGKLTTSRRHLQQPKVQFPFINNARFYFKKTICKTVTNPDATYVTKAHVCYTFKKCFYKLVVGICYE